MRPVPSKPSVPGSGTGARLTVEFPLANGMFKQVPRGQADAEFCPLVIVIVVGTTVPFQVKVPVATAPKTKVVLPLTVDTSQLPEVKVPLNE